MTEKSPKELERDAERLRADINETAEQLRDKMTPGQLIDEMVNHFKDGDASRMLSNFKHQVRDNPMALALVGSGLAWLMAGSGASQAGNTGSTNGVASEARRMANTVGDKLAGAQHSASNVADAARETAEQAGERFRETIHDARDYAHEGVQQFGETMSDLGSKVRTTFLDVLEREPLVVGALGVAVGAAIGAMVPSTRAEERDLGRAGAQVRAGAEAAVAEGVERVREVATEVSETTRDEARRQGLAEEGETFYEKTANVARAAGSKLRSEVRQSPTDAEEEAGAAADRVPDRNNRN